MRRVRDLQKRFSTDQLLTGIELPAWKDVLQREKWAVDAPYLHRAAWVTAWSVPTTVAARVEDARFGRALAAMDIDPPPLFLLGHWRSGTTHLHNCIGRMPTFTYPTVYQVVFPGAFLTTRDVVPRLTKGLLPETRGYDNVKQGWDEAAEDEIALAKTTGLSPYLGFMFPEHAARYERYVDFLEATADERDRWKEGFRYFLKKVMYASGGRQVVLKSCTHTARIRLLREMFPTARFVYIHRHPYRVFSSTLHMRSHTDWENFFQVPWENWEEERERQTLILGQRIFERYLEDRSAIPEDRLVEIAYDDFVGREVEVLRDTFSRLGLDGWERGEPALREYLAGLEGYRTNALRITEKQKAKVRDAWHLAFSAHGYSPEKDA